MQCVTRMPLSDEPLDHQTRVQQLFIEHQQGLRAYVLTIVRDFVLAQDVMQDAFLVVTRKAHEFDLSTNFIAWAATIARFRALDALRQANKPCLGEETLALLAASDSATRPDYRSDWLARCLAKLTPTVQRLLRLRYEEAMKPAEIGRLVGWTANAVCVATSRARTDLRKCIEQHHLNQSHS